MLMHRHRRLLDLEMPQYINSRAIAKAHYNETAVLSFANIHNNTIRLDGITYDPRFVEQSSRDALDLDEDEVVRFFRDGREGQRFGVIFHTHPKRGQAYMSDRMLKPRLAIVILWNQEQG